MGRYLGSWKLEDVVTVPVQTSSVTTGAANDADSVPTWRVYEDATATPVTTGSFATLNAQTGFYAAQITLAATAGFEKGKSYSVRVAATVNSIAGADVHGLQIEAEVDANSVSATVNAGAVTVNATSAADIAGRVTLGSTSGAAFADAVWGATRASHATVGSFGEGTASVQGNVTGSVASVTAGVTVGATAQAAIANRVTAGSLGAVTVSSTAAAAIAGTVTINAAAVANAVWDEPKAGHVIADTFGEYLDATASAAKADTAAIKSQTDKFGFNASNAALVDIRYVNDTSVTGNGASGTEWGPGT